MIHLLYVIRICQLPYVNFRRICGNKISTRCNRVFLLQILLLAEHVSGTTMPIIRSSRVLYSGCCLWYFVLWFSSCWSVVELRVMCPVCRMLLAQHVSGTTMPIIRSSRVLYSGCCLWYFVHEIPQAATTV